MHAIVVTCGTCDATYAAAVALTKYSPEMISDLLIGKYAISHEYSRNQLVLSGNVEPADLFAKLVEMGCDLIPVAGTIDTNTVQEDW